jgi:hypothetical protein
MNNKELYRNIEKVNGEVKGTIHNMSIYNNMKNKFILLLSLCPLNEKQTTLFLTKFNSTPKRLGYLYRHLIRVASEYGVPKTIINNAVECRKNTKLYPKNNQNTTQRNIAFNLLFQSTLEMIYRSNSRHEKIHRLIHKIEQKRNQ